MWAAPSVTLAQAPADPWPRPIQLPNASVLVYQPQVEAWNGNQIQLRAAMALQPAGTKAETFGTVFATARTEVDHETRTVVFSDISITKSNFPTLADKGAAYVAQLKPKLASSQRTISLDRLEASMKVAGSWADRESQARSSGSDRFSGFSGFSGSRFGGGGFGGRFAGGGFRGGGGFRR